MFLIRTLQVKYIEGKKNFVNEAFHYEKFKIFKYFNNKKGSLLK